MDNDVMILELTEPLTFRNSFYPYILFDLYISTSLYFTGCSIIHYDFITIYYGQLTIFKKSYAYLLQLNLL